MIGCVLTTLILRASWVLKPWQIAYTLYIWSRLCDCKVGSNVGYTGNALTIMIIVIIIIIILSNNTRKKHSFRDAVMLQLFEHMLLPLRGPSTNTHWFNASWINNHMLYKVCDEIPYPFPNFHVYTIAVYVFKVYVCDFILRFIMSVITYLYWD